MLPGSRKIALRRPEGEIEFCTRRGTAKRESGIVVKCPLHAMAEVVAARRGSVAL